MADNFASYFPTTITGGTTNPMVGADVVQGPNPQALGLDPIIAAIQSQYTPQTFTQSGGSYGAGRFITNPAVVGGVGSPVTSPIGGNVAQPWFTPGAFDLESYRTDLTPEVAQQVATGDLYGGSDYSPVSNVGDSAWQSSPYAGLDPINPLFKGIAGSMIPGAGMLIGAGQGYAGATATNTLNDVLGYLGQEGFGNISPAKASVLGAFGITPQSIKDAQDFYKIFDKNDAVMLNWAALPKDAATNQIVDFLMEGAQNPLSPQDIGVMAFSVGTDINKAVVEGKSLTDAVRDVAISKGIDPTRAAEMGVQASRSAVDNALKEGLTLEDIDPAAVAVYNDPLGALIDSLGITGRIDESLATQLGALDYATPDDISEALAGLNYATPEDVASAVGNLNYATADDIVNALADLNFTTPDDMAAALENLNFATPQDVIDGLANAGYATTDDIANALAGLDIPTVDDFVAAIATPVTGEVTSGTSFQPANPDGSFVSGIPDVGVPDSIDDVLNSIGVTTPSSGGTSDGFTSNITDGGYQGPTSYTEGEVGGVTVGAPMGGESYAPDYGSISDFGGSGSDSYAPTANEISFSESGGYTADVGGYDATSGYDSDTDSGGSSGGGGGGGGKIVCTAMNEAYGFGSFRNRIWLKYSAEHMTKAHEAGYHTLFLPLVDLAYKKNFKPLRVVLENIARHRSADLRAEMRGSKRDKLGRAYRFVLEPLCYIVGKLKGY